MVGGGLLGRLHTLHSISQVITTLSDQPARKVRLENVISKIPNKTERNWVLVFCFHVRLPDTVDQSIINTRIIGEENEEKTVSLA